MEKARKYIDDLTVTSKVNVPAQVVADDRQFFTWDNEKRRPGAKPYLFEWSYYNGVVMEGLLRIYEADPEKNGEYWSWLGLRRGLLGLNGRLAGRLLRTLGLNRGSRICKIC